MEEDKDKEAKRLNFPFCNRKFQERFECLEVCINRHFEEKKRVGPFLADCNRNFFLLKINTKQSEDS
jgi:hypothetical protein